MPGLIFRKKGNFTQQNSGETINNQPPRIDWKKKDDDIPDDKEFTKCVSNPPYRDNAPDGQRKNILIKMIDKYFKITKDEVWLLLNHRCFNSLTPLRLSRWRELGWSITFLRILNIKKWYGRYYWICFKQGGISIVNF